MPSPTSETLESVWGSSATDVYAVGASGTVLHFDGTSWDSVVTGASPLHDFYDVHCFSADEVYAVGQPNVIYHYDGSAWATRSAGTSQALYSIWGPSRDEYFGVGSGMTIVRCGPTNCSEMSHSMGSTFLDVVYGFSSLNAYAGGNSETVAHYNGSSWVVILSGVATVQITGIWGSSGTDVYFAGGDNNSGTGLIHHYDTVTWTTISRGTSPFLFDIWGSAANDIFAVGSNGYITHYNGIGWTAMTSNTTERLRSVWGTSSENVFAVGDNGTIMRFSR